MLDFLDVVTFQLIYDIQVYVKRTNEVIGTPQFIGAVNLKPKFEPTESFKVGVQVGRVRVCGCGVARPFSLFCA